MRERERERDRERDRDRETETERHKEQEETRGRGWWGRGERGKGNGLSKHKKVKQCRPHLALEWVTTHAATVIVLETASGQLNILFQISRDNTLRPSLDLFKWIIKTDVCVQDRKIPATETHPA